MTGTRRAGMVIAVAVASLMLSTALPVEGAGIPDPGGSTKDRRTAVQLGKHFGYNSLVASWDSGVTADQQAALIKLSGGTVHHFGINWAATQPKVGAPFGTGIAVNKNSPLPSDRIYVADLAAGLTPYITVVGAPKWASDTSIFSCALLDLQCLIGLLGLRSQPPTAFMVDAYTKFISWVSARYPLAIIGTWNEPNESYYWGGRPPDPVLMATMQCAAYDTIKAARKQQRVAAPGIGVAVNDHPNTGTLSYRNFMGPMYAAMGGRICWDILSVHLYIGAPPYDATDTQMARQFVALRATRTAAGDKTPIWVSETGLTTSNRNIPASAAQQAAAQTDGVHKLLTIPEVKAVLIHTLRDGGSPGNANNPADPGYGYGVVDRSLKPKPGFCHWVKLAGNNYQGC